MFVVPKGLSEGSLAVYSQENVQIETRPVEYGVIGSQTDLGSSLSGEHASRPTQTVRYGTVRLSDTFLAVNCQATFT
jgi:hypothetical protein